jgi:hypothetical protein
MPVRVTRSVDCIKVFVGPAAIRALSFLCEVSLTGELDAQRGTVVRPRKMGVLRQDQYAFDAYRVIDTFACLPDPVTNVHADSFDVFVGDGTTVHDTVEGQK